MKKMILCASVYLAMVGSYQLVTANENKSADNNITEENTTTVTSRPAISVNEHIKNVYNEIDFNNAKKVDYDVFEKAYYGYLNLLNSGKLADNKDILTIVDFSKSSKEHRLWVMDMKNKKVLINDYVAHGQGSGGEFATAFSNTTNSHQSSLGFYVTGNTYYGKHGLSLRMHGMDKGYNSAAFSRAIVVHGADYVSDAFVKGQNRLGRSWGCPAVSRDISDKMINTIKDGSALFVYAPQKQYLQASVWLNKKINQFPAGTDMGTIAAVQQKATDTTVRFTSGKY